MSKQTAKSYSSFYTSFAKYFFADDTLKENLYAHL